MKKLGLKCGLELHVQLEGKKLFCDCPAVIKDADPDYSVTRRQRAVVGETGEIDAAAAAEALKRKDYVYSCWDDCVCLVDLDEEPPRTLDSGALHTAVQVGKLFGASFVDEVQVMRKTIVDGSIPAGFQRTSLVAYGGSLDTSEGKVSIPVLLLEEDAARILDASADRTVFGLDRVGIPLLEISTGPDIVSPDHAAETAEKIGLFLRSTGRCRRGLGTIRQDVNVSIRGGTRVEIKGAQDLKLMPKYVELEAERQRNLLDLRDHLKKNKVPRPKLDVKDLKEVLAGTKSKVVLSALKANNVVLGTKLVGFAGLLGRELQPSRRVGSELSDYAKVRAGVGGIFHSDELPAYGITLQEVDRLRKHFDCGKNDAFVLVAGEPDRAGLALEAVVDRANLLFKGVPPEVRRPLPNASTAFLRPIPGAARMYPETDTVPVPLSKEFIDSVALPELIDHRVARYLELGLSRDLSVLMAKSDVFPLFEACVKKFKDVKPAFIAETLLGAVKNVRSQYGVDISPAEEDYFDLFTALNASEISKDVVLEILSRAVPVREILSEFSLMSDKDLEKKVKAIARKHKGLSQKALMGVVMGELKGKASGKKIAELVEKLSN